MEYILLEASGVKGLDALTEKVNEYLGKGWRLYGNPIINRAEITHFYQAMVRETELEAQG